MRLLVVEPRPLFPRNTGAKILSSNILAHLRKHHDVTLLVNVDAGTPPEELTKMAEVYTELLTVPWKDLRNFTPRFYVELGRCLVAGQLYTVHKFCTPELKRRAGELVRSRSFDVVLWDTMSAFLPDVDFGATPRVALTHNVEYLLRERQASLTGRGVKAAYLRYYARKTREFEMNAYRKADHVVALSQVDADFIRISAGIETVSWLPPGVDASYFAPGEAEAPEPSLAFSGSMDWQANQDAVEFFVREVLPIIKKAMPNVRFTVVGRQPPPHIRALADADPKHVEVTGTVDDVRPYVARAQVVVVPIRFGSGIKIKVFEAMGMAKPVVVTTIGAEGLPLRDRDNTLIADTPDDFAASCIELLKNADLRRQLGERARATVLEGHDWSVVAERLAHICEELVQRHAAARH